MMLGITPRPAPKGVEFVTVGADSKRLHWLFDSLKNAKEYSWDIETSHSTSGDDEARHSDHTEKVIGISFCWSPGLAVYLPLYKNKEGDLAMRKDTFGKVLFYLKQELEDPEKDRFTWNGIFDRLWMWRCFGIRVAPSASDGMLAHHLLDEGRQESGHKLKECALAIDPNAAVYESDLHAMLDQYDPYNRRYSSVPVDILAPYACADALFTYKLVRLYEERLKEEGCWGLYQNITMPLQDVIFEMEVTGIPVDEARIESAKAGLEEQLEQLTKEIWEAAGQEFVIGDPAQLSDVLFGKLGLKPQGELGKDGYYSTKKEILADLEDEHPIVGMILKYRRAVKLHGTYVVGLKDLLVDGRYYQDYFQHGTVSGRLSERLIVLLPKGEKGGDIVKGQFVAPPGWSFVFRDLSQIELRYAAHISGDPVMCEGFRTGGKNFDMHAATAQRMFSIEVPPGEDVSTYIKLFYKAFRSIAKNVNFLSLYGGGAKKLMDTINKESPELKCTLEKAKEFLKLYFEVNAGLLAAIEKSHADAHATGQVVSMFGRVRRLPDARYAALEDRSSSGPDNRSPLKRCFAWFTPVMSWDMKLDDGEIQAMDSAKARARLVTLNDPKFLNATPDRTACKDCVYLHPCLHERERRYRSGRQQAAFRQAFNFLIQSSCADYTNLAFIRVWDEVKRRGLQARPVLQIHDALGFLVPDSEIEDVLAITKDKMENAWPLAVPVLSEASVCRSWGDENLKVPKVCQACKGTALDKVESDVLQVGKMSSYRKVVVGCKTCGWSWQHDAVFRTEME